MCYAFRGEQDKATLRVYVKYTDESGKNTNTNLYHEFACTTHWQYECADLNELARSSDALNNRLLGSVMNVKDIYISDHVMVDDVWIGNVASLGKAW